MISSLLQPGHVFVIAEAGVNHNGDPMLARKLIDAAVAAGADAVKFQLFDPDELTSEAAPLADYQKRSESVSQTEMLRRLALTQDDFRKLASYAKTKKIHFIVTPFDIASARFLVSLGVPALKIPSGELTNIPFLHQVGELGVFTILSTGMATMQEVHDAIRPFQKKETPFALLHCVSAYPAPVDQINLRAMETLKKEFNVPVGYSDHTQGIDVSILAAALGAEIIEKHFTLDRGMKGPDHAASLEPDELAEMIRIMRDPAALQNTPTADPAIGTGEKRCQPCEENVRAVARRSVVVTRDLATGTVLTTDMLAIKRPGTGIPPKDWKMTVGKRLKKALAAGSVLTHDVLE